MSLRFVLKVTHPIVINRNSTLIFSDHDFISRKLSLKNPDN
jgi:hypothetical protein